MADPDQVLEAEATGVVPEGLTLPAPMPGDPALPAPPAPPQSAFVKFLGDCWRKLTSPTTKKREDYRGRLIATFLNRGLDKGPQGHAHDAQMGEAVDLVVDHLTKGANGGDTPLGMLMDSSYQYVSFRYQAATANEEADA